MLNATVVVSGLNDEKAANRLLLMLEKSYQKEASVVSRVMRVNAGGKELILRDDRAWLVAKGYVMGTYHKKLSNGYYDGDNKTKGAFGRGKTL